MDFLIFIQNTFLFPRLRGAIQNDQRILRSLKRVLDSRNAPKYHPALSSEVQALSIAAFLRFQNFRIIPLLCLRDLAGNLRLNSSCLQHLAKVSCLHLFQRFYSGTLCSIRHIGS